MSRSRSPLRSFRKTIELLLTSSLSGKTRRIRPPEGFRRWVETTFQFRLAIESLSEGVCRGHHGRIGPVPRQFLVRRPDQGPLFFLAQVNDLAQPDTQGQEQPGNFRVGDRGCRRAHQHAHFVEGGLVVLRQVEDAMRWVVRARVVEPRCIDPRVFGRHPGIEVRQIDRSDPIPRERIPSESPTIPQIHQNMPNVAAARRLRTRSSSPLSIRSLGVRPPKCGLG